MRKQERADYIAKRLNQLFPEPPIPLEHRDPYTLLIAVLLSAQCTDKRVNQVTPSLFALADTPEKMAAQDVEQVREIVRPCGLSPTKARAIVELSHLLVEHHDGEVPESFSELEKLPGVGHKTASVVMSQAFGHPAFPVDTHIHRIAQQWGLSSGRNVVQTERDLKDVFPQSEWNRLHIQIIYYGREYCPARGCDGLCCQICQHCYPQRKTPRRAQKP